MKQAPALLLSALLIGPVASAFAEDIILRLRPEAGAPIVTRITATEKVLMDAAPAGEKGEWMQLDLKIPFEGYVPEAALTKNFAIMENTPAYVLPDAATDTITRVRDGDLYEIVRVKNEWATVQFKKQLPVYFRASMAPSAASATPAPEPDSAPAPEPPVLDLSVTAPTHTPQPDAVGFDPELGVGKASPDELPPENVAWKSAPSPLAPKGETQIRGSTDTPDRSDSTTPPYFAEGNIMVGRAETQARETATSPTPDPDKPLRRLTGILIREIEAGGPAYPVRLRAPEGRLIAYVDFSGFFIKDLSPYLNQRVDLRGQIAPVRPDDQELVIFAHDIQLSD